MKGLLSPSATRCIAATLLAGAFACNTLLGIEEAELDPEVDAGLGGTGGTGGSSVGGTGPVGGSGWGGGSGGAAGSDTGPPSCGLGSNNPCLADCYRTTCCDEARTCTEDPECSALFECSASCGDSNDCYSECLALHPSGTVLLTELALCTMDCGCGGAGGAGGSGPAACGDGVAPNPQLVRTCVLTNSCDPTIQSESISSCISYNSHLFCTSSARSCEDIEACVGKRYEDSGICTAADTGWKCVDNRAVRCGVTRPYSIDCDRSGGTCDVSGITADGGWPCRTDSPGACSETDPTWYCYGNWVYTCIGGQSYGRNCSLIDYSACVEPTDTTAYCSRHTATCDDRGVVTCNGDSINVCYESGHFETYDCVPGGGRCETSGTSEGFCLAPGCTQDDERACEEECLDDGFTLSLCVGGAPYPVSCVAYGFSECVSFEHPYEAKTFVYCR